jgi:hypothetical protein
MIRAVLDTNVILAALLSRRGASFELLQRLRRGEWRLVLSNHLLLEYEEILKRNAAALSRRWKMWTAFSMPSVSAPIAFCCPQPSHRVCPMPTMNRSCASRKRPAHA